MIRRKLRQRRGATLSELLVALAVMGLATLAVTVGTTSGLKVYRQSVALSDAQTLMSTLSQAIMDDLRFATEITADGSGTVTSYASANYGLTARLVQDKETGRLTVNGHELVGSGAYAGLQADADLAWDEDEGVVTVTLSIHQGEVEPIRTETFAVRPLNPQEGGARPDGHD